MSLPGHLLSHIQFFKNPIFDRTTPLNIGNLGWKTIGYLSRKRVEHILTNLGKYVFPTSFSDIGPRGTFDQYEI